MSEIIPVFSRPWHIFAICILLLQQVCSIAIPGELQHGPAPISSYAASPGFLHAGLSPGGDFVFLYRHITTQPEITILHISPEGAKIDGIYELPVSRFRWAVWADSTTLLVAYVLPPKNTSRAGQLIQEIVAIDVSVQNQRLVLSFKLHPIFLEDGQQVLNTLPEEPGEVLLSYAPDGGFYPGVFRLNYETSKLTEVEAPTKGITKLYADWQGKVRLGVGSGKNRKGMVRLRESPGDEWANLDESPVFEQGRFQPIAFSHDGKRLYLRSAIGTGRFALYEFGLRSRRIVHRLFEHPEVDVEQVIVSVNERKPAAVTYIDDAFRVEPLSDGYAQALQKTRARLPGYATLIGGNSADGRIELVYAEKAPFPPELFVHFNDDDRLIQIGTSNAHIADRNLSMPERATYFSRDGLEIPAYLTFPAGDNRKHLPTIIMPHGGPAARDLITFDHWAQFLASRGYLIVQPNFRGSSGYGWYFQARGFGEWGEAMQDDLSDAVRWAVDSGIADPDRICIVGGSYGGYAALMGTIETPELFKCAVSFAPVTDLDAWLRYFRGTPGYEWAELQIRGNRPYGYLKRNSPARQAGNIGTPLLLIHGSNDMQVPISHSEKLVKALKKTDVDFNYIVLDSGSHFLFQEAHRQRVLTEMEGFLGLHIGGAN